MACSRGAGRGIIRIDVDSHRVLLPNGPAFAPPILPADEGTFPSLRDFPMRLRSADQLVPRPRCWLWPHRLALGELALLEGDPGLGKSVLLLDLCARLTTGRPCPDNAPGPG